MGVRRFEIEVPRPFRLDLTAWALRRRPHNAVDRFDGTSYRRTLVVSGRPVEVAVSQRPGTAMPQLAVELHNAGAVLGERAEDEVGRVLDRSLGLGIDLSDFYRLAAQEPGLAALAERFIGMRPPRFPSVFEAVVNAVACQQLSLTVGIHLLNRLARRYGSTASDEVSTPGFPTPEQLAGADPDELRALGFSRSKAATLLVLANRVATGDLDLEALDHVDDEEVRRQLLGLHGIGRWSAEYVLLRGLGRIGVLPGDDVGARNNLRRRFGLAPGAGYDDVAELARTWSPYGGLVYFHLLLDALANSGHVTPTSVPEVPARRRSAAMDQGGAR